MDLWSKCVPSLGWFFNDKGNDGNGYEVIGALYKKHGKHVLLQLIKGCKVGASNQIVEFSLVHGIFEEKKTFRLVTEENY